MGLFLHGCLLVSGIALISLGVVIPYVVDDEIDQGLRDELVIDSLDHKNYDDWVRNNATDAPAEYYKFYVFNITNAADIPGGAKPVVEEIGPYVYRQIKEKLNVQFLEGGDLVEYLTWTKYIFDPSESFAGADPLTDAVNTVSLGYLTAAAAGETAENLAYRAGIRMFNEDGEGGVEPVTIDSLLFRGLTALFQNYTTAEEARENLLPERFRTGKNSTDSIMQQVMWEGVEVVDGWAEPENVTGTDATQFKPRLEGGEELGVWLGEAYRVVTAKDYGERVKIYGIDLHRFNAKRELFYNATYHPPNAKYYMTTDIPNGLVDISVQEGAPVLLSQPRFLYCDLDTIEQTIDMPAPDPELHDTVIDVEPISGTTMSAAKRFQLNVKADATVNYPDVKLTYLPILWIQESGDITEDLAQEFKDGVYLALMVSDGVFYAGIVGGALLMVSGIALFVRYKRRRGDGTSIQVSEHEPLLNKA